MLPNELRRTMAHSLIRFDIRSNMKLKEAIIQVLTQANAAMSPQEIKEQIKVQFPQFYGTDKAHENVAKGNYSNLDHALLAPIYNCVRKTSGFLIDETTKPFRISLISEAVDSALVDEDVFPDDLLKETGLVYVLNTGVFTATGKRIIKIGFTTQDLNTRINQLYTTGSPFRFDVIHSFSVTNYYELEQSMHKLFDSYRLSNGREFFSEDVLEFVEDIVRLHDRIQTKFSSQAGA